MKKQFVIQTLLISVIFAVGIFPVASFAMESATYEIISDVIGSFGDVGNSTTYQLQDTGGEIGTGNISSNSYDLSAGFQQANESIPEELESPDEDEEDEEEETSSTPEELPVTSGETPISPEKSPEALEETPVIPAEVPVIQDEFPANSEETETSVFSSIKEKIKEAKDALKSAAKKAAEIFEDIKVGEAMRNLQDAIKENPIISVSTGMAGAVTASVSMAFQFDSLSTLFSALRNGLGLIFLHRKKKEWGMVYDALNGKPIAGALVSVFNEDGRKLDGVSTDKYGAYAFLVSEGKYRLEAQKEGFKFVSNYKSTELFYADNYKGEYLDTNKDNLIRVNIPLIAEKVIEEKKYRKYLSYVFRAAFYGGFALSIFAVITVLSVLNITVLIMYTVSMMINEMVLGKVKWGKTLLPNGKDASFAYIKVRSKETGELVAKVVSDNFGRYYLILNPGKYELEAVAIDGSCWSDQIEVLKRKVINKKIKLQKQATAGK